MTCEIDWACRLSLTVCSDHQEPTAKSSSIVTFLDDDFIPSLNKERITMKLPFMNPRRLLGGIALGIVALAMFFLVYRIFFPHDEGVLNPDDLMQAQLDQPAAGHRRLSASQTNEIPLSSQYEVTDILPANNTEEAQAVITEIGSKRPDQRVLMGEQLRDGSIVREILSSYVIIDRDGRLERIPLSRHRSNNPSPSAIDQVKETLPESAPVSAADNRAQQELPRAGFALKSTATLHTTNKRDAGQRNNARDQQIAQSAQLPGYHLEQRNRMIVPQAPNSTVLDTPERIVPKAQGNRLPTASYTPPQS